MCSNAHAHSGGMSALGRNMVMRLSSSFVTPSAVAVVSTILLCGPATSQTATGSGGSLPSITVDAPKQVARPLRPERVAPRRTSSTAHTPTAQTSSASPEAIIEGPGSTLGKLARLEKASSSCNGGCETAPNLGTPLGLGVARREGKSQLSRQRAETHSPTRTTGGAWTPKCSRAGIEIEPGGIAPACPPAASSRSPNSSDQDASPYSRRLSAPVEAGP